MRLRKAARTWRKPEAREAAHRAMVAHDRSLFAIDPERIFGRRAPLEVELGAGKGEFLIERAALNPGRDFLAVELSNPMAKMLAVRCGRARLGNLRVVQMDARTLVNLMLDAGSVRAYHIYFPDPWPKERHCKHRLFTPHLVASLRRTLEPGGRVFIASDVAEYAARIFELLGAEGFREMTESAPGAEKTGFARKYAAAGKPLYAGVFERP
ncbi:MAG TPA: hypothetical protein VEC38_00445 [Candidatus Binataceae bacterium]|nr:hypothetical protein [Candidatus Binataceae bacterium]